MQNSLNGGYKFEHGLRWAFLGIDMVIFRGCDFGGQVGGVVICIYTSRFAWAGAEMLYLCLSKVCDIILQFRGLVSFQKVMQASCADFIGIGVCLIDWSLRSSYQGGASLEGYLFLNFGCIQRQNIYCFCLYACILVPSSFIKNVIFIGEQQSRKSSFQLLYVMWCLLYGCCFAVIFSVVMVLNVLKVFLGLCWLNVCSGWARIAEKKNTLNVLNCLRVIWWGCLYGNDKKQSHVMFFFLAFF